MALGFGWRAGETWESYWPPRPGETGGDDAFGDIPEAAIEAWEADGDGEHLRPFLKAGKTPTKITFRVLTPDEVRAVQALVLEPSGAPLEKLLRAYLLAFRLGADFPEMRGIVQDAGGGEHSRHVLQRGMRMLAPEIVAGLDVAHPGLTSFFGRRIFEASFPSEGEKKVSSPPSMQPASTTDTGRDEAGAGSA